MARLVPRLVYLRDCNKVVEGSLRSFVYLKACCYRVGAVPGKNVVCLLRCDWNCGEFFITLVGREVGHTFSSVKRWHLMATVLLRHLFQRYRKLVLRSTATLQNLI